MSIADYPEINKSSWKSAMCTVKIPQVMLKPSKFPSHLVAMEIICILVHRSHYVLVLCFLFGEWCFFSFYGLLVVWGFSYWCYILSLIMTARAPRKSASFLLMKYFFLLRKSAVNKVRISNLTGTLDLLFYIFQKKEMLKGKFFTMAMKWIHKHCFRVWLPPWAFH